MNFESNLVTSNDISSLIDELHKAGDRARFDSSMKRFEESFIHRYKSANPPTKGKFPFGFDNFSQNPPYYQQVSQPFSNLGSFYSHSPSKTQQIYHQNYSTSGYEQNMRSAMNTQGGFIRTEYVPYPYPYHPPHEFTNSNHFEHGQIEKTKGQYRRNPLRESMELRKVKEELFQQTLGLSRNLNQSPPILRPDTTFEKDNFRSYFSKK